MRWHPVWPARARASRCNPPHRGASAPRRSGRCPMRTGCSEPFAPCFRYASSRRRGIVRRVRLYCRPRRSSRFLREGSVAVRPTQDRRRCTPIREGDRQKQPGNPEWSFHGFFCRFAFTRQRYITARPGGIYGFSVNLTILRIVNSPSPVLNRHLPAGRGRVTECGAKQPLVQKRMICFTTSRHCGIFSTRPGILCR